MTAPVPPEPGKLATATAGAALVATLVLVVAVLPAEYGIDPTGIGTWAGFTRLSADGGPSGLDVLPEDGIDVAHAVEARWEVIEFPVLTRDGYTEGPFGETRVTLPLNLTNLSTLTARLTWNDTDLVDGQPSDPDEFEISVRGPGNTRSQLVQGENMRGGEGNVSVTLPWRSLPAPTRTDDGALRFPIEGPDTSSHGEWTFLVRLYAARGLEGHDAQDPGNGWTLTVTARTYELRVDEQEGGGDRVSITIGPGRGLEYKFQMEPNATLTYSWTSSAPVYWDLHAEEAGHDPEDFTRLAEGTSRNEGGSFTATFAGRYGWYFQNRGPEPLTVSLTTRGEYRILGVV